MTAKERKDLAAVAAPKESTNTPEELEAAVRAARSPDPKLEPAPKPKKQPNRKKLTLDIDGALIREVRVACVELPPKLTGGGPSGFVSRAVEKYLAELRAEHNQGEPFESDEEPQIPRGPKRV